VSCRTLLGNEREQSHRPERQWRHELQDSRERDDASRVSGASGAELGAANRESMGAHARGVGRLTMRIVDSTLKPLIHRLMDRYLFKRTI